MLPQEREHAPGRQQTPCDRLNIEQFSLSISLTLHAHRISAHADHRATPRGLFSSLLASAAPSV
jgi:hypothetical protein